MYSQWTNITERDLIQKGASYKRIKTLLNVEKLVLNMTLPNVGNVLVPLDKSTKTKGVESTKTQEYDNQRSALNLSVMSLLAVISGQRPQLTKARQSIANWKIRKNQVLGFKVTLRGKLALDFLDKTVRFQNINEQNIFTDKTVSGISGAVSNSSRVDTSAFNLVSSTGLNHSYNYSLQSLGNLSLGVKSVNFYPELEDLWLAQTLSQKSDSFSNKALEAKSGATKLGLDICLNFKTSKEVLQLLSYILRKSGGKKLVENYFKNVQSFPTHIKTNKYVLAFKNCLILRRLYLTSLGFYPSFTQN